MDWQDLKFFAELARAGSLSAAARALKVDHSTVARRVAALEDALGTRLFDRLPRGYSLTPEGEALAGRVRRLQDEVHGIERMMQASAGQGPRGTVRLGAPPAFAGHFIAPRLGPFRRRHPGIELVLATDSRIVSLTRREADLALRMTPPEDASLVVRRLCDLAYGLYAARAYAASHAPEDWDFLGYDESLEHVPQQRWIRHLAGGRPLAFRSSDLACLLGAVEAGLGVAALPVFMAGTRPDFVRLDGGEEPPPRGLWLVVHEDLRRAPPIRAAMDFLTGLVEKERRLLEGPPDSPTSPPRSARG